MSEDLYHRAIVDAAESGRGHGRLDAPDTTATVDNPLCGDRVTLDVRLDGERIGAVGQLVRGCLLCEAAGAIIARRAPGETPAALRRQRPRVAEMLRTEGDLPPGLWPELAIFRPVRAYKSRHDCVLLAFEALDAALAAAPEG